MGYGIIAAGKGHSFLLEMGVLKLDTREDHAERLLLIFNKIKTLIEHHHPVAVAIEAPFFGKNVQSMLKLGRAQGVAIAAAMSAGLQTVEYAPRKIKQSVTGNGNATKEQVWKMLQHILKFEEDAPYMDATDAVAVALCHYYQLSKPAALLKPVKIPAAKKKKTTWEAFATQNPDRVIK